MYVSETDTALTVGTTDRTVVLGFDKSRGTVSGDIAAPLRCNSAQSPGVNDGKADNQCVALAFAGMAQAGAGWAPPSCPTSEDLALPLDTKRAQSVVLAVSENQRAELRLTPYSRQLTSGGGKPEQGYPAVVYQESQYGIKKYDNAGSLRSGRIPEHQMLMRQYGVRRLTPVECERLQGFPDDWTAGQSDSKRYKQLGNAVCVPVAEWIGRRIMLNIPGEATE